MNVPDYGSIPSVIINKVENNSYKRDLYLGRGGFASCYQVTDLSVKKNYACKIISKQSIKKPTQKDKVLNEINIHRTLTHGHIVNFHNSFEDSKHIYIILELCKNRSMMELHKRRRTITEKECRYYMYQIIDGIKYLHDNKIIHRDIKLGNLFLNDDLHVKIGDFGLAIRQEQKAELRRTLCGTPNYVAPEILTKQGHSYEVDIWSLGCLMYTLLIGKPPFETDDIKTTYDKIKKCDYYMPKVLEKSTAEMISAMLQPNAEKRPKIDELLNYKFMTITSMPKTLPFSCLTIAPRFSGNQLQSSSETQQRKPLVELNTAVTTNKVIPTPNPLLKPNLSEHTLSVVHCSFQDVDYFAELAHLQRQLLDVIYAKPMLLANKLGNEYTTTAAHPLFWISKWVDYTQNYGFGFQLCTNDTGVKFRDDTYLMLFANGIDVMYIDGTGEESYMTTAKYSITLEKKMKLLHNFKNYMTNKLTKTGGNNGLKKNVEISRVPFMHTWLKTQCAIIMYLSNGTVQLNFKDHNKLILCPSMSAVTYIDKMNHFYTYRLATIIQYGCTADFFEKLRYATEHIGKMIQGIE